MLDLDPEPGLEIIRMMSSTLKKINSSQGKKYLSKLTVI